MFCVRFGLICVSSSSTQRLFSIKSIKRSKTETQKKVFLFFKFFSFITFVYQDSLSRQLPKWCKSIRNPKTNASLNESNSMLLNKKNYKIHPIRIIKNKNADFNPYEIQTRRCGRSETSFRLDIGQQYSAQWVVSFDFNVVLTVLMMSTYNFKKAIKLKFRMGKKLNRLKIVSISKSSLPFKSISSITWTIFIMIAIIE